MAYKTEHEVMKTSQAARISDVVQPKGVKVQFKENVIIHSVRYQAGEVYEFAHIDAMPLVAATGKWVKV